MARHVVVTLCMVTFFLTMGSAFARQRPLSPKDRAPRAIQAREDASASNEPEVDPKKQIADNIKEIKALRQRNPACLIERDTKLIRNISVRNPKKGQGKYYRTDKIVYVRDRFYCTGCKRESSVDTPPPCCKVSNVKSFNEWRGYRQSVEETDKINKRIDELYRENAVLSKKLRSSKE